MLHGHYSSDTHTFRLMMAYHTGVYTFAYLVCWVSWKCYSLLSVSGLKCHKIFKCSTTYCLFCHLVLCEWLCLDVGLLLIKVKVKLFLEQDTKAQRESRCIALLFLQPSARWGWVVSTTPRPLYPRGKTRYPLYRRLGGPQGRSGRMQKISPPTRIRSPDRPARGLLLIN